MQTTKHQPTSSSTVKWIIFWVSGVFIFPVLLRDCVSPSSHDDPTAWSYVFPSDAYDDSLRPNVKPQDQYLTGLWVPLGSEKEVESAPSLSANSLVTRTHIKIENSNNIELNNFQYLDDEGRSLLTSRDGNWNLYQERNYWELLLYSQGVQIKADLLGTHPPYQLRVQVGDPMANEPRIFIKANHL